MLYPLPGLLATWPPASFLLLYPLPGLLATSPRGPQDWLGPRGAYIKRLMKRTGEEFLEGGSPILEEDMDSWHPEEQVGDSERWKKDDAHFDPKRLMKREDFDMRRLMKKGFGARRLMKKDFSTRRLMKKEDYHFGRNRLMKREFGPTRLMKREDFDLRRLMKRDFDARRLMKRGFGTRPRLMKKEFDTGSLMRRNGEISVTMFTANKGPYGFFLYRVSPQN